MAQQSDFSIVVRSSDCLDYFPSNTPGDFYVRIPHKLELEDNSHVSVHEIWITKRWYNMRGAYIAICLSGDEYEEWYMQSGYYSDNSWLVSELNRIADNASDGSVNFTYNDHNHRLYISTRVGVKIRLSPNICSMLGYVCDKPITGVWVSPKSMDVCITDRFVYVHTDIGVAQVVGDDILPVVKIIDTTDYEFGGVIHDNNVGMYIPVVKKMFDVIHVELRDSSNSVIKFEGGVCVIHLHFRRQ
jgi:hypothetical protein